MKSVFTIKDLVIEMDPDNKLYPFSITIGKTKRMFTSSQYRDIRHCIDDYTFQSKLRGNKDN